MAPKRKLHVKQPHTRVVNAKAKHFQRPVCRRNMVDVQSDQLLFLVPLDDYLFEVPFKLGNFGLTLLLGALLLDWRQKTALVKFPLRSNLHLTRTHWLMLFLRRLLRRVSARQASLLARLAVFTSPRRFKRHIPILDA